MRPSLTPLPLSRFLYNKLPPHHYLPLTQQHPAGRPPRPSSRVRVSSSWHDAPGERLRFGDPEPPWLVKAPAAAPRSPASGSDLLVPFQTQSPPVGIPFSLRLVQLKKKRMKSRRARTANPADLGAAANAVRSLASALEEIQRCVLFHDADDDKARRAAASPPGAEAADSVVWLFHKVFYTSPDLAVSLLVLVADFLSLSLKKQIQRAILEHSPKSLDKDKYKCWFDLGILHEGEEEVVKSDPELPDHKRRAAAYENMIASGMTSSVVLANYAQLLFQFEKDLDRAHYYFRWAVMQEPPDAEALNKYAFFLWIGKGDLEAAEEMFLEALEIDPKNGHHGSTYAWFLWSTGGLDTCYPLGEGGDAGVPEF